MLVHGSDCNWDICNDCYYGPLTFSLVKDKSSSSMSQMEYVYQASPDFSMLSVLSLPSSAVIYFI